MPTGYTATLCEKEQSFEEFVWGCARAFGAFIMQRDDGPNTPPILDEKVSDYHEKALAEAKANLEAVRNQKPNDVIQAHAAYVARTEAENARSVETKTNIVNRLNAMLAKVVQWEPPSPEHEGMKKFMINQLHTTIDFDGKPYTTEPIRDPDEWHRKNIESAEWSVAYHEKGLREETERVNSRNQWKRQLLESVPLPK